MYKRLLSTALVFGAAALAPPAEAQTIPCMPRHALVDRLEHQYGENLIGGGLQSQSRLIEVWSSEKTGSFTIFMTRPSGISCVIATGRNWNSSTARGGEDLAG